MDSKMLSILERRRLCDEIKKKALYWVVHEGDLAMINRLTYFGLV